MSSVKYLDLKKNNDSAELKELSDNELVKLVQKGDTEKYGEVIDRYQGKLFAYLYRLMGGKEEAEDLLQDVFIKAYKNLNSYDTERKFSSWIYRIAHNEAVNLIKRKSLKRFVSWEDISSVKDKLESSSTEEGADKAWARKESIREVDQVINKLPIKYKQVLLLRYYSDKTYEEIGEILEKPVNTVGTLINRAKKKFSLEMDQINNSRDNKKSQYE